MVSDKVDDELHNTSSLEACSTELISLVGTRVLATRKSRRYSRRELSERSGVSTRYLVQLESGKGNISIGLLQKIAMSLGLSIEELVRGDNAPADDIARVSLRFQQADASTRAQVLRILDPEHLRERKSERLCLIGLRGAGKSTLGARLSQHLHIPFIELNEEIERSAGIPLSEIIALYGEEGYRTLEAETLQTIIAAHQRLILAVAGGLVEQENTFNQVLGQCHTIWLQADPTEHMERVRAQGDLRPMEGNPRAMAQLQEILLAREPHYRQAECHLNTSGKTVDESFTELHELVLAHKLFAIGTP